MSEELKPTYQDDQIDLFALIKTLWKEKVLIILFTLVAAFGGAGYAFMATPTFSAEVRLLPPSSKDVAELNKLSGTSYVAITNFTPSSVFERFVQNLESSSLRKDFLARPEVHSFYNSDGQPFARAWKGLSESLVVSKPGKNSNSTILKLTLSDPELAADFANAFVESAINNTKIDLISDFQEELTQSQKKLSGTIESRKATYVDQIQFELIKLKEAKLVASKIGIDTPIFDDHRSQNDAKLMVDEMRRLYRLGTVTITAEIEAMQARMKDDSFVPGLVGMQQQLDYLYSISLDTDKIHPVIVDLEAVEPLSPIKPKKSLILALSVVLGAMAGVMYVLIRSAVRNRNEKFS
jgi:chain length determinant protein (polysaccharide antigen chain regulator)